MVVFLNSRSIYREQVCSKLLSTCCSGHPCHTLILYLAEKRNFIYTAANIFLQQHILHVAKTAKKTIFAFELEGKSYWIQMKSFQPFQTEMENTTSTFKAHFGAEMMYVEGMKERGQGRCKIPLFLFFCFFWFSFVPLCFSRKRWNNPRSFLWGISFSFFLSFFLLLPGIKPTAVQKLKKNNLTFRISKVPHYSNMLFTIS